MPELREKYPLTNLFVIDTNLWNWAKSQASELGFKSVSEYIFELLELAKENWNIQEKLLERFSLRLRIQAEQSKKRADELKAQLDEEREQNPEHWAEIDHDAEQRRRQRKKEAEAEFAKRWKEKQEAETEDEGQ